jgi:predicted aspartyl protease
MLLASLLAACVTQPESEPPVETILYAVARQPDDSGRIVVPVIINGAGPYLFMVDSGSTHTVLTSAATQRLGLQPDMEHLVRVRSISGLSTAPTTLVADFHAGELALHDRHMPVLSGPVLTGLDGILGMDGLVGRKISVDLLQNRVTISEATGQPAAADYIVIPFMPVSARLPVVAARIGRIQVKAVIDTGATQTLGNRALLSALLRRTPNAALKLVGVLDAAEVTQAGALWSPLRINLSGVTVDAVAVAFGGFQIFDHWQLSAEPALLIGMDVLGALGELHLDYKRQELQIRSR